MEKSKRLSTKHKESRKQMPERNVRNETIIIGQAIGLLLTSIVRLNR